MGDYDQFGNCFKAMHAMAIVGMWAIIILIIISLTGLAFGIGWIFNHVAIH